MLVGWRGNPCLLSIPDIGHNVSKVESTSYWPWSKTHTWNVVKFIDTIPRLQDYLIALMCFYWGIWSCALLRIPCSLIYPLSQLFVLFWSFFFTLMNPSLTKRYSPPQFSCHPLNCLNSCSFHGCENSVCKCFEIPQCTPRQAMCARSAAWRLFSVLPGLSTALELVVSCMDGVLLAVHCVMYQPEGLWVL